MVEIEVKQDVEFIKTDHNTYVNPLFIRWVKQMDECLHVCVNMTGCNLRNTHTICKSFNPKSYEMLIRKAKIDEGK